MKPSILSRGDENLLVLVATSVPLSCAKSEHLDSKYFGDKSLQVSALSAPARRAVQEVLRCQGPRGKPKFSEQRQGQLWTGWTPWFAGQSKHKQSHQTKRGLTDKCS